MQNDATQSTRDTLRSGPSEPVDPVEQKIVNSEKRIVKNGENNRRNRAGYVLLGRHPELFREGSIHLHLQTYHPITLSTISALRSLTFELLNLSTFEQYSTLRKPIIKEVSYDI